MSLKINVPYNDKNVAKSKGAFWDLEQKTWFIPDHKDINDFQQWIDKSKVSVIIKSPVSIALNSSDCYKCANKTAVISLASNNFYHLGTDENDSEKWFRADGLSFFSMAVFIENELAHKINRLFPNYKIAYSKTAESSYWANHCDHCGALQGDFFLHSEPGGAFFPLEIEEYEQLTFITVPSKFDVGIDADYSWLSNTNEVPNYAKSITLEEFLDQRE
ncbi:DUF5710 domain-containing protein [Flavobacterium sp.]|uniref:DUF5710 domain-containing protein n=1 Tax=Flavobacterium sp. TaxID=239 RepID=UPI0032657355